MTTKRRTTRKATAKPQNDLEKEAKEFVKSKTKSTSQRLTVRRYFAGQALAGLLARSPYVRVEELKREAYRWADIMLEEED